MPTMNEATLKRSRTADRIQIGPDPGPGQDTALARVEVREHEAQEWRVTLSRIDPGNGRPPLVPASTVTAFSSLIRSRNYQYSIGRLVTPADPPRRDNPCAPPDGSDVDPIFVEIGYGQSSGQINRLAANWPVQGASVVVVGSYVEVFAYTFLQGVVDPPAGVGRPFLAATITPTDGLSTNDSGELSIQQLVPLDQTTPTTSVVAVPEFARRVRVAVLDATQGSGGGRIPATGDPRLIGEWFDDQGNVCDAWIQGSSVGEPADWEAVPARAVLLRLVNPGPNLDCNETFGNTLTARVHWRVAP
jgi:hypothetical protein